MGRTMSERPYTRAQPFIPPAPMHFMRGPIAGVLPEVIDAIPGNADITITQTRDETGAKALTITASWKEDQ